LRLALNMKNMRPIPRVWPGLGALAFLLVLIASVFFSGCAKDETGLSFVVPPDTSFLQIFDLEYRAANDTGRCESGLNVQWYEFFYSNYGKSCRIKQYVLLDPKSDTIFNKEYSTVVIQNGETHYARTKWIDVEDPIVDGAYSLCIFYRHSDTEFQFDTTFDVFHNQSCD